MLFMGERAWHQQCMQQAAHAGDAQLALFDLEAVPLLAGAVCVSRLEVGMGRLAPPESFPYELVCGVGGVGEIERLEQQELIVRAVCSILNRRADGAVGQLPLLVVALYGKGLTELPTYSVLSRQMSEADRRVRFVLWEEEVLRSAVKPSRAESLQPD